MRTIIYFLCLIMASVLLSSCTHERKQINETVKTESYEQHVPTVYDVLQEREDIRWYNKCESIYLAMPEQILTHLLVTKGTTQSMIEIVEDYISNKKYYHDTILNSMNIQKQYFPDSIPKKSEPDTPNIVM